MNKIPMSFTTLYTLFLNTNRYCAINLTFGYLSDALITISVLYMTNDVTVILTYIV